MVKVVLLPFGGETRVRKKFVDFAGPRKGEEVLDICSGTGMLTSLIEERVGSSGQVVGIDLARKMVEIARKNVTSSVVSFYKADAERLPFPDDVFDKTFISFGLHEMPQTASRKTFEEIYRTLKWGGYLFVFDYNLPRGAFTRLAIKAFVSSLEEESAYKMLLDGSLKTEIEAAGLVMEREETICSGMVKMIQARRNHKRDNSG